ncbi:MAG: hypothetical protein DRJ62_05780 [Thermoprotei archaeon]|nr:MAG: hypothetical protein DRJ62_05780 [Thermoprotei archaeon]
MTSKVMVTGRPGVGKTTVVLRVVEQLKEMGLSVGGIITLEVRSRGVRVGFKMVDLATGREATLASVCSAPGPRVGKYLVHVDNLNSLAVSSIEHAIDECHVVVIDELGPMEFKSQMFVEAAVKALSSQKPLLATLHYKLKHPLLDEIRRRRDVEILEVTEANRDRLPSLIVAKLVEHRG